jgi:alanine-synthesizing transaminase
VRFALVENTHRIRQAVRNIKGFLGRYHNVIENAEKEISAAE